MDAVRETGEHVLVVGCGYVGMRAAARLAEAGHRVTGIRRSADVVAPEGVTMLALDVGEPEDLARLPTDADVVIVALSPGGREVERYEAAYLEAPAAVLARQQRPPRLVLLTTSTAVYDTDDGGWVDEALPVLPPTTTATVLHDGEQSLAALVAAGHAEHGISLRLGGIYGPGRTRLLREVRAGEATCHPKVWTNRIHLDDAASAIAHLVATPVEATVLNVVDDEPAPQCEVMHWLAEQLGAPEPTVLDATADTGRRGTNKRVSNAALRATGWTATRPSWREGYADLLHEADS